MVVNGIDETEKMFLHQFDHRKFLASFTQFSHSGTELFVYITGV